MKKVTLSVTAVLLCLVMIVTAPPVNAAGNDTVTPQVISTAADSNEPVSKLETKPVMPSGNNSTLYEEITDLRSLPNIYTDCKILPMILLVYIPSQTHLRQQ